MKKKLAMVLIAVFIAAMALVLSCNVWLWAYHNQKNNDNLPGLSSISEMDETEINKTVCGYKRTQLNYMWKAPDETGENQDVWSLGGGRFLQVNYSNQNKAVSCHVLREK